MGTSRQRSTALFSLILHIYRYVLSGLEGERKYIARQTPKFHHVAGRSFQNLTQTQVKLEQNCCRLLSDIGPRHYRCDCNNKKIQPEKGGWRRIAIAHLSWVWDEEHSRATLFLLFFYRTSVFLCTSTSFAQSGGRKTPRSDRNPKQDRFLAKNFKMAAGDYVLMLSRS